MKKKAFFLITTCLLAAPILFFWGCNANNMAEEFDDEPETLICEPIGPCGQFITDTVLEFKDFPTRMYFETAHKEEGPKPAILYRPIGIVATKLPRSPWVFPATYCPQGDNDSLWHYLEIPLGAHIMYYPVGLGICNYPVEADSWNRKNLYKGNYAFHWEGELDVIISGKIYAYVGDYGLRITPCYIDLTSITKLKTQKTNNYEN